MRKPPAISHVRALNFLSFKSVLPCGIPRVAVEAGVTEGWYKYVGLEGKVIGIDRFGECGPANQVFEFLGITAAKVAEAVAQVIR